MNEISFKDFNKSILNNGSFNNLNPQVTETNSTRKMETKTFNESAVRNMSTVAKTHSNTTVLSTSSNNRSAKQTANNNNDVAKVPFKPAGINSTRVFKKTVAENNLVPYEIEKDTLYSTWTPLSDETTNSRVYNIELKLRIIYCLYFLIF